MFILFSEREDDAASGFMVNVVTQALQIPAGVTKSSNTKLQQKNIDF